MSHLKIGFFVFFAFLAISFIQISAQVTYSSADERKAAGMGAERVARFFTPAYESAKTTTDDEVLWIQIDLNPEHFIICRCLCGFISRSKKPCHTFSSHSCGLSFIGRRIRYLGTDLNKTNCQKGKKNEKTYFQMAHI